MTKTRVVVPLMPSWESPEVPYACEGGMTARTRLPTFLPTSAVSRPGSMVPPITVGLAVKVLAFWELVVPSQKYRTKLAAMASALVTVAPVPGMTVLTVSALSALTAGIFTVGVLPNAPVTDTLALFTAVLAEALELALGLAAEQPAMTRQASSGIIASVRRRRIKTSIVGDGSRRHSTGSFVLRWPTVWAGAVPRGAARADRVSLPRRERGNDTRRRGQPGLHAGDELLYSLVDGAEGVLAQDGALGLVVQLQVDPVDGEVPALLLGAADELAAELGAGGLRGNRLGLEDVDVTGRAFHRPGLLQQVVQAAAA